MEALIEFNNFHKLDRRFLNILGKQ